MSTPFSRCSRQ